jgi:hypothetical protein
MAKYRIQTPPGPCESAWSKILKDDLKASSGTQTSSKCERRLDAVIWARDKYHENGLPMLATRRPKKKSPTKASDVDDTVNLSKLLREPVNTLAGSGLSP